MSYFSKNLKFLREKKKLSQNKLAEMSGVNQTTIARWETEEVSPSLDNIYDLAETLNVSIADLTGKDLTSSENTPIFNKRAMLFNKIGDLPEEKQQIILNVTENLINEIDKEMDGQ